ncbi:MAG: type I DNA topoisomerase [Microgenomates group bacterium]
MQLIIVESPTKARTLSKFLGDGYSVEATTGHIKDLPKSTLGVDVEKDFEPEYIVVEKRKETIAKIIKEGKKADMAYLATDPDREGEAISSHVKEILKGVKTKRIVFHEITKEAVEEAIKSPRDVDANLVDAQTARRVLDRLVGYKLSPLLWKKVRIGLSAGRVQTVSVRLIVEKEREIEKFKPVEYWEISCNVKGKEKKEFLIQLVKTEVGNEKDAKEIVAELEKSNYKVSDVKKREVVKNPYPPFTTSTMTQAGARIYGWSSKKTMSIAQKLYEEGFITYHRTDSVNLASVAVDKLRNFVKKEYGESYLPAEVRFYKKQSKSAQEAHEAIRPTDVSKIPGELKMDGEMARDFEKLYELIWRRYVACQMASSVYDETTIEVEVSKYKLRASGQVMKFDGWRKVMPNKASEENVVILPNVEKGEDLDLIKVNSSQKFTQPPARYNEASLIKTLEKLGIGRPSTYAPIISTIQIRNYVEKNDARNFAPTTIGFAVNDFLVSNFPEVFDYEFTAKMEDDLDRVADGKLAWVKTIKDFYKPFEKKLKDVEKNSERVKIEVEKLGLKCPDCKEGELVIRTGRFGKFISCSRFPECKHTEKYLEKVGIKCPDCKEGDVIVKKTSKGRKFFGCSRYPDCKFASWRNPKVIKEGQETEPTS